MESIRQKIHFCTTSDGVRIAYSKVGSGPPLVWVANWLSHVQYDWDSPVWRHWINELSKYHTLIRYDQRCCGLSDRGTKECSLNGWIRDMEAVIKACNLDCFDMLGVCQGGPVGITYATRHPGQIQNMILYGSFARGKAMQKRTPEEIELDNALLNMVKFGWGKRNPAFRQVFTTLFMPDADEEQKNGFTDLQQLATSPECAFKMLREYSIIDVADLARKVDIPTLVMHGTDDAMIPIRDGRELASLIPNATFVSLKTNNHILMKEEPAWEAFLEEMRLFLGDQDYRTTQNDMHQDFMDLTPRESDVLDLIAMGLSNNQIADRLFISPKTVRNHITNIFSKLNMKRRAEVIIQARNAGFGLSN